MKEAKQAKGYWYMKATNRSIDYKSIDDRNGNAFQDPNKGSIFCKQYQSNLHEMQKKVDHLQTVTKKINKIEQFFQLMCSGQYGNMGIRCFEHNNQLIFYCNNDHKLLCANCMYATREHQPKLDPQSARSKRSAEGTKKHPLSSGQNKHSTHEVKQISKSIKQITSDINTWQSQYKTQVSLMNDCKGEWQKLRNKFEKSRTSLCNELDKQYDKMQMKLSKQYLDAKKQLNNISEMCLEYLEKIANYYKSISKLIIPNRYPVPTAKQSWLFLMKNKIFDSLPMRVEKIPNQWHKIYTGRSKLIIKRFLKAKVHETEQS